MAKQHAADVHPEERCPLNKRYDLMDANKKVDLKHVQCLPESKILTNIIKNHPLRFNIAASSFVPWIYMAQFWHTLKEDGSKYRLRFMLDKKELSLTLDDFRTIFHLPQANDNNHNSFMPPPSFSNMVPFYKQQLGFTMELKTSMYADVFGLDVPLTQSQPTEYTQGTYRTPSAPRSPTPKKDTAESISLAEHKSREEQEARENVELVNKHLASKEIEKLVEGFENVIDDSLPPMNDEP
ncbi:hypothetical protein Tco_0745449 [Tanacetum coccineum]